MKTPVIIVRRPLAAAGMCFVAAVSAAYFVSVRMSVFIAAAVAVFFLYQLLRSLGGGGKAVLLMPCAVAAVFTGAAALVSGVSIAAREAVLESIGGEETVYTVSVTDTLERGNALRVVGDILAADGVKVKGVSVLFYIYGAHTEPGDEMTVRLSFYPGPYDASGSLRFNAAAPREILGIEKGKHKLPAFIHRLKSGIGETFYGAMPRSEASVASALVTGETGEMDIALSRMLQRAGVSHIVVVSGMHITLLLGLLSFLLTPLKSPLLKGIVITASIAALMLFYGFTPSVVRACVMGVLVFFGRLFYYESDGATALSAAAVLILLFTPSAIKSVSFQLSFACCLAIVTVYPFLRKRLRLDRLTGGTRLRRKAAALPEAFLLSLTINIVTLPVLILNAMPVSLVSPLSNPLVVPLVLPAMLLCLATAVTGLLIPAVSILVGAAAAWAIRLILGISGFFAGFPYAAIDVGDALLRGWALFAAAAVSVYFFLSRRRRFWPIALIVVLPLAAGLGIDRAMHAGTPEIIFYSGQALILRDEGHNAVIINRMSENDLAYLSSYLLTKGIDKPQSVTVLRLGSMTVETVERAFPDSEILLPEKDYTLKADLSVGRMKVAIERSGVLISSGERTVAAALGDFPKNTDVALFWRDAKTFEDTEARYVLCYEDIAPEVEFNGRAYDYRSALRLLIKEERVIVRA